MDSAKKRKLNLKEVSELNNASELVITDGSQMRLTAGNANFEKNQQVSIKNDNKEDERQIDGEKDGTPSIPAMSLLAGLRNEGVKDKSGKRYRYDWMLVVLENFLLCSFSSTE